MAAEGDRSIAGQVALVTGSGAGIGRATAEHLAGLGCQVVIADINGEAAEAAGDRLRATGAEAVSLQADITQQTDVEAMVAAAIRAFGRIDVVVNNAAFTAGVAQDRDLLNTDLAHFDRAMDVNVRGALLVTRAALPSMLENGHGIFVNIASRKGLMPARGNMFAYSVSKAALCMLSRHVAASYGKAGVRCNVIAPGAIRTEMSEAMKSAEQKQRSRENVLTAEVGEPIDIARAVAFLAGEGGRYITGQVWSVDGGALAYNDT